MAPHRGRWRRRALAAALLGVAGGALGPAGCAAPKRELAPQVESQLFRGLWQQSYAQAAEARCWRGFPTARGAAPPDPVPFFLSVGPGGEVTRAQPDLAALDGADLPAGFTECLAQIIRGMRFPATGEPYVARVQADRPRPASAPAP